MWREGQRVYCNVHRPSINHCCVLQFSGSPLTSYSFLVAAFLVFCQELCSLFGHSSELIYSKLPLLFLQVSSVTTSIIRKKNVLNIRNLFLHSSRGWRSRIRVTVWLSSGESARPGWQMATFILCPHMAEMRRAPIFSLMNMLINPIRKIPRLSPQQILSVLSHVCLFATPWTTAHQAPLSMGFPTQEYWSGLPFPFPGDFPDPGIKTRVSGVSCNGRQILFHWTTWEAPYHLI